MDPNSLAADDMDVDENRDATNDLQPDLNIEDLIDSATLQSIKVSLDFIQELKRAFLDDGHLAPDVLSCLKNPPSGTFDLTPDKQLSLELFISMHNTPQHVYTSVKNSIER